MVTEVSYSAAGVGSSSRSSGAAKVTANSSPATSSVSPTRTHPSIPTSGHAAASAPPSTAAIVGEPSHKNSTANPSAPPMSSIHLSSSASSSIQKQQQKQQPSREGYTHPPTPIQQQQDSTDVDNLNAKNNTQLSSITAPTHPPSSASNTLPSKPCQDQAKTPSHPLGRQDNTVKRKGSNILSATDRAAQRKQARHARLFREAITIDIPLSAPTVDLGVVLKIARQNRIDALHKAFPACKKQKVLTENEIKQNDTKDGEMEVNIKKVKNSHVPQPQEFDNVLDYLEAKYVQGVMVDETDGGDEEGDDNVDDDEGAGSVYSESSFINDTDLQRTVAEQVLAHATTTKLELQEDDNEFFVNVGNLEIEETEMHHPDYDPLQDTNATKTVVKKKKSKPKDGSSAASTLVSSKKKSTSSNTVVTKKRKDLSSSKTDSSKEGKNTKNPSVDVLDATSKTKTTVLSTNNKKRKLSGSNEDDNDTFSSKKNNTKAPPVSASTTSPVNKKSKKMEHKVITKGKVDKHKQEEQQQQPRETKYSAESSSSGDSDLREPGADNVKSGMKSGNGSAAASLDPHSSHDDLERIAKERKDKVDELYQAVVLMIQSASPEELPRKKTKERVSLTCPADKNPGDTVLFSNPHVPGQRLKVKIPKNLGPGRTFRVSVPIVESKAKMDGEIGEDDVDHNKLGRNFHDTFDDYARAYDEWCDAEGAYRKAIGDTEFAAHLEKRMKFNELVNEFPKDLKTPIDLEYMKKILRRARQNRSKREQTLARQAMLQKNQLGSSASAAAASGPTSTNTTAIPDTVTSVMHSERKKSPLKLKVKPSAAQDFFNVVVPVMTKNFSLKPYNATDFAM